jgi:hypothetical protein
MRAIAVRFALALLAGLPAAPASAHFVFIQTLPVPGGSAVHAGFGEPGQWDRRLARNIEPTVYFVRTDDGKEAEVRLRFNDRAMCFVGTAKHTGPAAVLGVCEYGVVQRGKAKAFLLTYYAKRYAGAASSWEKLGGSQRLKVEVQARHDGKAIALTALAEGKPLANAEINARGPKGERKLKADAEGKASWPAEGPGEYAVWVSRVTETEGDRNGRKYAEVREVATLTFALPAPKAKAEELKADAEAAKRLGEALRAQAAWDEKFPGFRAALRVDHDGGTAEGTVAVAADGEVKVVLDGAGAELKREVLRRL